MTRQYEFNWDVIGDLEEGRPNLGGHVHLALYRLMQYTFRDIAEEELGNERCDTLFFKAGKLAGMYFFEHYLSEYRDLPLNPFIAELQRVMKELGVGILRIEKTDIEAGLFVLTMSEDLDCSGLPDTGLEVCKYDEGFLSGIFQKYTGRIFHAREVSCWASGDRTCRFEVQRAS